MQKNNSYFARTSVRKSPKTARGLIFTPRLIFLLDSHPLENPTQKATPRVTKHSETLSRAALIIQSDIMNASQQAQFFIGTPEPSAMAFMIVFWMLALFAGLFIIELKARWRLEKELKALMEAQK